MDPSIYQPWLIGVGIGAVIAAIIGGLFLKSKPTADGRAFSIRIGSLWPGAIMIGVCAIAGWAGLMKSAPHWPPTASDDRLGWVFVFAAILCVFAGLLQRSFAVRAGLAAMTAVLAAAFTLYSPSTGVGALGGKALPIGLSALGMIIAAGALGALEWRGRRISTSFIVTGLALAVGAALIASSSSKFGFFSWSIVPAAAMATAICAFRTGAAMGSAAHVCAACVLGAALVAGFSYSDLKWISAAIFAICPLLALIADAVLTPMLKPRMAAIACILAAAIPAAAAIALSAKF